MSRYYDEQFKREVAKEYLSGERTMDIVEKYGLRWLCRKFNLSTNAYYNYLEDQKSDYRKRKRILLDTIKNIYYDNNRIIGHRGMTIFLKQKGISLSKTTVPKYMNRE